MHRLHLNPLSGAGTDGKARSPATARPNVRRARAAAADRSVARVTRFAVGNGRLGRLKRGHAMWGTAADYLKRVRRNEWRDPSA